VTPVAEKTPESRFDLIRHFYFIGHDNPRAAERFLDVAEDAFNKLAEMPGLGPEWGFKSPKLKDVRFWPIRRFRNYLIFYRRTATGINVIRVIHGAQDVEQIFKEESPSDFI
jgi:toxin ParE1/3/4